MPYATLVAADPATGAFGPGLAQTFGYVGTGNKTYELKLRPNLKFSDGTPVTSQAVKDWLTYFPKGGGGYASLLKIASIDTPDSLTVRLNLATPTPLVTSALAQAWGMIPTPKAVADPKLLAAGAAGAGPYMYDDSATVTGTGSTYTFVPNPYYYDKSQIKWSKVVVKAINDPATMLRAVESGQVDVATGDTTTISAAKQAGLTVSTAPAGWVSAEILDTNGTKVKALGDVRVRQALNYAINRPAIVKALYGGQVQPISTEPGTDGYNSALDNAYPYDPAKAKQLLAAAGYPNGFSFSTVSAAASTGPVMQAMAQDWQAIGVKANVVSTSTDAEFFQKFLTQEAFLIPFPSGPTLTLVGSRYTTSSPLNPLKADDPVLDQLYAQALVAAPSAQEPLLEQIMKRITDQAYAVPVATSLFTFYSDKKVGGVTATKWLNAAPGVLSWTPSN
jgi:peptide/nickel transport system substrate-binding protein